MENEMQPRAKGQQQQQQQQKVTDGVFESPTQVPSTTPPPAPLSLPRLAAGVLLATPLEPQRMQFGVCFPRNLCCIIAAICRSGDVRAIRVCCAGHEYWPATAPGHPPPRPKAALPPLLPPVDIPSARQPTNNN